MSVLIVAEHLGDEVREVTFELVSAARELGGPVELAVIGQNPSALDVSRAGIDTVIEVAVERDEFENDTYQSVVEDLIAERGPRVVLLGFTVNSMGFAPAIAAKLGFGFASDVFAVRTEGDEVIATRAFYGSKVHAELEFPAGVPVMLLLRPTVWHPVTDLGTPNVITHDVSISASRARHRDFIQAIPSDVDITSAEFLVAIGRGIGDQDNIPMFEELAAKLGAELAASRPLVDAGWIESARQVGQSGTVVKPKLYLALGISGAVQHLAGMKGSETIIAVNTDPEAAIFGVADYGAVADVSELAVELGRQFD